MKKSRILIFILFICFGIGVSNVYALDQLNCSSTLKSGSTNKTQVVLLQNMLNEISSCGLVPDGLFGPATTTCVQNYQRGHEDVNGVALDDDGKVGPLTCGSINLEYSKLHGSSASTSSKPSNSSNSSNNSSNSNLSSVATNYKSQFNIYDNVKIGKITGSSVNARTGAGTSYSKVRSLPSGVTLNVVGYKNVSNGCSSGKWYAYTDATPNSSNDIKVYYVCSSYVSIVGSLPIISDVKYSESESHGVVLEKDTWLRDSNYKQVKQLSVGTTFKIYGVKKSTSSTCYGYWYQYDTAGTRYVCSVNVAKDNFITVSINDQKLVYYRNGHKFKTYDVITGKVDNGVSKTKKGVFNFSDSDLNVNYTSRSYGSFFDYWMPFNGGIGFHDATDLTGIKGLNGWRTNSEFTATRYINYGSHGCVNMKEENVRELFIYLADVDNLGSRKNKILTKLWQNPVGDGKSSIKVVVY